MKKLGLFVCHDLVGLLMLNKIVPVIKDLGLAPVIFNTGTHANKNFKNPSPDIVSALNVSLLEEVIIPFLEQARTVPPNLTYKQLAQNQGFDYREIRDVNAPALVEDIAADPGFLGAISLRLLQVFSDPMIEAFRSKGFMWNLHSGLLPDYKGLLTPYRAIENEEHEYGVTLHEMARGIDEGGIVAKSTLPLDHGRPVLDLYLDTVDAAGTLLAAALSRAAKGDIPASEPQSSPGAYYSNPTKAEFKEYTARNIFYIHPQITPQRIVDAFAAAGTPEHNTLGESVKAFLKRQQ